MQRHDHLLSLINIYKSYGTIAKEVPVLTGISIQFHQGRTYALTGVSGSGKSTLLHILGGLDIPTSGSVHFDDNDIANMSAQHKNEFLNHKIGFVFQFHYLIKELSVLENIMMLGLIRGGSKKQWQNRAQDLLALVGLADKASYFPSQLSGGEQQRASLARALCNKPAFLLADEPTGNLDAENASRMIDILLASQREWGMGIVLCSHDPNVYNRMEVIYQMRDGTLITRDGQT